MPDIGSDLVRDWLDRIGRSESGAALWHNTPVPLVEALARHVRGHAQGHEGPPRPVEPGIFALDGGLLIGVMCREGALRLVSPQSVLRDRLATDWTRVAVGSALYLLGPGVGFVGAAEQAQRSMDRAASLLALTPPPFRYYVPGARDFPAFARIEARMGHRAALAGWGWTDPHGGDVVSRDPVDAHELTHAVANALAGWPPSVMREGLAECFTTPVDRQDWASRTEPLALADVWDGGPGAPPGWYAAAALLVTVQRRLLGLEGLKALWRDLARRDGHATLLARCGWSGAEWEAAYRALWQEVRAEGHFSRPSGLAALWGAEGEGA